jgi:hypothetical protein
LADRGGGFSPRSHLEVLLLTSDFLRNRRRLASKQQKERIMMREIIVEKTKSGYTITSESASGRPISHKAPTHNLCEALGMFARRHQAKLELSIKEKPHQQLHFEDSETDKNEGSAFGAVGLMGG